jgi:gamma-glutamylputrescine oxidase
MTTPYWLDCSTEPIRSIRLHGRPDVVVVGGGVTGCACALTLARGGLTVRLHEARMIAGGASGRNGGFALRGGAMPYDVARTQLGADQAQELWRFTERSLEKIEHLAGDAFRRTGSLRLAAGGDELARLTAEYEALRADGFAVEWVADLDPPLEERFPGAIRHPVDGALHPARWVRRLAELAADAGVDIRERSPLKRLADAEADVVVIATDGYTRGLVAELDAAVRPTRGQVVVTEPLPRTLFACPHYARDGYDYWQQTPDRRLVVGGWRDTSLEAEFSAEEAVTPEIQRKIEAFIVEVMRSAPQITHRWAGIFGTTADRMPLVGPLPHTEAVWVSCGYSGHGNVLGFACGGLVADAILGRPQPVLRAFDPGRLLAVDPGSARVR